MTGWRYWLPRPLFSLFLALLWLLLVNQFSIAHTLLGLVLGAVIPFITQPFWPERSRIKHLQPLAVYLCRLLTDILKSNLVVARLILWRTDRLQPAFVTYPLALSDDFAVTILASTISLTPGTVSAHYDHDAGTLLIHCLHLEDENALIHGIRTRYEQPLREMFDD